MTTQDSITDRRVRRTRRALIEAFNTLVTSRRYEDIKVSDIIEAADVGRSTFYEHYSGRDAIHLDALSSPMSILADAATGQGDAARLSDLLAHFWENRALARASLAGPQSKGMVRLLADQITERLQSRPGADSLPIRLAAMQLAEGHLGLVKAWVSGEGSARPDQLAPIIIKSSKASLDALFEAD